MSDTPAIKKIKLSHQILSRKNPNPNQLYLYIVLAFYLIR